MRTCGLGAVLVTISSALLLAASGTAYGVKEGGTFRITGGPESIDPALDSSELLHPACGTLLTGANLRPDIAEREPVVARNGRTYTFTIRKDARFSTGAQVTAPAFARAIKRIRDPAMESRAAADYEDVREVVADGRTLILRLTKPVRHLPTLIAGLCAVPPNLPADPEGARAPLASAAPYYVAQYVPGERLVLERNRFYIGSRVHHVDRLPARVARAQVVKENLSKIGLEVEIKPFPPPLHFQKMATPGEPFDIADAGWFGLATRDPSFLNWMFDGKTIANAPDFGNYSYFNSPKYNRLLDQASRLTGAKQDRAYRELDVQLTRDAAPAIPFAVLNTWEFVSARVGCVVMKPSLDLTAVCLK
jgi:ABC-type transport system substrate-binding protein